MADVVGVYAASHTPVMLNLPQAPSRHDSSAVYAAFKQLGARISAAVPQVIVLISDDHLHNFFLDNLPAFCIGTGDCYPAPIEEWLRVDKRIVPGDRALGAHLLREIMQDGFDPANSMQLTLDHGMLAPLELAGIAHTMPVVPIFINCVQPPLPSMARCLNLGQALGRALRTYRGTQRVAVLATGGLSHDVGTPRMGMVNEQFDRDFLECLVAGDDDQLLRYCEARVNEAGNGAEEIRNWIVAHGIAGGRPFVADFYKAIPEWYTGIGFGSWPMDFEA